MSPVFTTVSSKYGVVSFPRSGRFTPDVSGGSRVRSRGRVWRKSWGRTESLTPAPLRVRGVPPGAPGVSAQRRNNFARPLLPASLLCKAPRAINREKVFHVCMFLLVLGVCCFLMRLPPCSRGVCGLLIVIRLAGTASRASFYYSIYLPFLVRLQSGVC